jgi:hypothetical protein
MGSGLLLAWGIRRGWTTTPAVDEPPQANNSVPLRAASAWAPPGPALTSPLVFRIEGRGGSFRSLGEVIAAAGDGATILIEGAGTQRTHPVSWQNKRLTLRAAPGSRPCLEMPASGDQPWQALLTTDRSLTIEGLELRRGAMRITDVGSAAGPLICCQRADLRLKDCVLTGPGKSPLLVCRNSRELVLQGCRIEAGAIAVSVEVGQEASCRLELTSNVLLAQEESAVALSLWAPEVRQATPVELTMTRNTFTAGRVIALRALPAPLTVTAHDNTFTFHDGLLGCDAYPTPDSWRALTTWRGQDNRYHGAGAWLQLDGQATSVRDIPTWTRLWDSVAAEKPH